MSRLANPRRPLGGRTNGLFVAAIPQMTRPKPKVPSQCAARRGAAAPYAGRTSVTGAERPFAGGGRSRQPIAGSAWRSPDACHQPAGSALSPRLRTDDDAWPPRSQWLAEGQGASGHHGGVRARCQARQAARLDLVGAKEPGQGLTLSDTPCGSAGEPRKNTECPEAEERQDARSTWRAVETRALELLTRVGSRLAEERTMPMARWASIHPRPASQK